MFIHSKYFLVLIYKMFYKFYSDKNTKYIIPIAHKINLPIVKVVLKNKVEAKL